MRKIAYSHIENLSPDVFVCPNIQYYYVLYFKLQIMGLRTILGKLQYLLQNRRSPRKLQEEWKRGMKNCQLMHKCSKISSSSSLEKFSMLAWFSLTSINSFTMSIFQLSSGLTGAYSKVSIS